MKTQAHPGVLLKMRILKNAVPGFAQVKKSYGDDRAGAETQNQMQLIFEAQGKNSAQKRGKWGS